MAPAMINLRRVNHADAGAVDPSQVSLIMVRAFRICLLVLGYVALAAWVFGFVWISSMACAFSGPSNPRCNIPAPWDLGSEDLQMMVIQPAVLIAIIFGLFWWLGRKRQSNDI